LEHKNKLINLKRELALSYIAAGVVDAGVRRMEAERGIYVVWIQVASLGPARCHKALPIIGRAEGAVGKDTGPPLVGDHPVAPQKL
jgi:hypothetical protein